MAKKKKQTRINKYANAHKEDLAALQKELDERPVNTRSEAAQLKQDKQDLKDTKANLQNEIAVKTLTKKNRKRNLIITLIAVLTMTVSGAGVYFTMQNRHKTTEGEINQLYKDYSNAFVTDKKEEIIYNLPAKKYNSIMQRFNNLGESTDKFTFRKWNDTLIPQFKNQQAAKKALSDLYVKKHSYLKATVTQADLDKALNLAEKKYNTKYQLALKKEIANAQKQFDITAAVKVDLDGLYDKNKKIAKSVSESTLTVLQAKVDTLANPELKADYTAIIQKASKDLAQRKRDDAIQAQKDAQQQAELQAQQAELAKQQAAQAAADRQQQLEAELANSKAESERRESAAAASKAAAESKAAADSAASSSSNAAASSSTNNNGGTSTNPPADNNAAMGTDKQVN